MTKSLFEEMGGKYEKQGDYLLPCLTVFYSRFTITRRRRTAGRHMGTAASELSEAVPQGYIHQSSQ